MKTKFLVLILFVICQVAIGQTKIDTLVSPAAKSAIQPTVIDYLISQYPEYAPLVKALNATSLNETLKGAGPFTVFAVTNSGFESIGKDSLDRLMAPENKSELEKMLSYNIIAGDYPLSQLQSEVKRAGGDFAILTIGHGGSLHFGMSDDGLVFLKTANDNKITLSEPSITGNGKVYYIPSLLKPESEVKKEEEAAAPLEPNK